MVTYGNYRRLNPVWVLIGINSVVFIVTFIFPALIYQLGLKPAALAAQPWTLITAMFVHGSIGHILGNMVTLYFFGIYVSLLVGDRKLLLVYFVGGIIGNLFFIGTAFLINQPHALAVGASGAIFAIGGVLAMMRPKQQVFIFPIPFAVPMWGAMIGGFVIMSFFPGVAWEAHLGGLLTGLAFGYFYKKNEFRRQGYWRR